MNPTDCPCGSGRALSCCCGPFLKGTPAPTAEALMRSRYTAFVRNDEGYILESWHPSTRPRTIDLQDSPAWLGLEVRSAKGGVDDRLGEVEFIARFADGGRAGVLHETSRFTREDGRWYYLEGRIHGMPPTGKIGRNEPCPCGSGKKFKRCCG